MTASVPAAQRHDQYYIETIVYQVENTLFRVPSRYFHEKSEAFSGASQISKASGEGSSDNDPVKLALPQDANTNDFLQLARLIYPLTVGLPPPTDLSRADWTSVLKLSTAWGFRDLRKLAIAELSKSDSPKDSEYFLERLEIGRRYSVKLWILEGLRGLSSTSTSLLPLEKLEALGLKTAMRLLYIRNSQPANTAGACRTAREDVSTTSSYRNGYYITVCSRCNCPVTEHTLRKDLMQCPPLETIFDDELSMLEME
ncbi:hypothetical protein Moror_17850 [Moniliophthora roreri MCA 2997]|nr:hypothetical protein Moror_17850 [Moniliophthora roreri MCA 2997]